MSKTRRKINNQIRISSQHNAPYDRIEKVFPIKDGAWLAMTTGQPHPRTGKAHNSSEVHVPGHDGVMFYVFHRVKISGPLNSVDLTHRMIAIDLCFSNPEEDAQMVSAAVHGWLLVEEAVLAVVEEVSHRSDGCSPSSDSSRSMMLHYSTLPIWGALPMSGPVEIAF